MDRGHGHRAVITRVSRKTMGFSKEPDLLESQIHLQTAYYNLVRPHRALAVVVETDDVRIRQPRTPAMTAGITDHPWTLLKLLTLPVQPSKTPSNKASEAA